MFLIGSVMVAVHHAELVALWLGEPYGTLVLTLAVTIIELSLIVSLMLTGEPNPGLARDTVHAVVMLVLNGLAGICIVAGTLRHREQEFRTLGANAFLAVLMPMAMLVLVLPNYTLATPGPYYSKLQLIFVGSRLLRALPRVPVRADRAPSGLLRAAGPIEAEHAAAPSARIGAISGGLLVLSLVAVILLAKLLAPFIERSIVGGRRAVQTRGRDRRGDRAVAGILRRTSRRAAQSTADQHQPGARQRGGLHRPHRPGGDGASRHGWTSRWRSASITVRLSAGAVVPGRHAHLRPGPHQPAVRLRPSGAAGELRVHDLRPLRVGAAPSHRHGRSMSPGFDQALTLGLCRPSASLLAVRG